MVFANPDKMQFHLLFIYRFLLLLFICRCYFFACYFFADFSVIFVISFYMLFFCMLFFCRHTVRLNSANFVPKSRKVVRKGPLIDLQIICCMVDRGLSVIVQHNGTLRTVCLQKNNMQKNNI